MEKDKNGENAPCFDCCFHPQAIQLGKQHKEFKDLLVTTAMEGVEKLYQQQGQDVSHSAIPLSSIYFIPNITHPMFACTMNRSRSTASSTW
jgi:hypothetical protein